MHKLEPVEEAKTLFEEAKQWGVWQWLTQKRRLRQTADAAWEALEKCEDRVKRSWDEAIRKAYRDLGGRKNGNRMDPAIHAALQRLKEADEEAYKARMDAEAQFDEADRRMSTSMAREGAQMAIDAWTMREKLIRKMEATGRRAAGSQD